MAETRLITLGRPDDWHVHLRDGDVLAAVAPLTARRFARAIVMPNLVPPVATAEAALAYRQRIVAALPAGARFTPLMTCYLTDTTDAGMVARGFADGVFAAVKLYPAHATTHSAAGVTEIARVRGVLERLQEIGMPLLVHGEVADPDVDVFDREAVFIDRILLPLLDDFPALKVVLEHATTAYAVDIVRDRGGGDPPRLAATITAHHLMITRNAMFDGGIRRTCTACRWPSASATARPSGAPPHRGTRGSSWAPIRRPTPRRRRKRRAAAPASSPPRRRLSCTPRCSTTKARWTNWKPSPPSTGPPSTGFPRTAAP